MEEMVRCGIREEGEIIEIFINLLSLIDL